MAWACGMQKICLFVGPAATALELPSTLCPAKAGTLMAWAYGIQQISLFVGPAATAQLPLTFCPAEAGVCLGSQRLTR